MKVNSTTTYNLEFPMKDGKKVHIFKIQASDTVEAQDILHAELLECCRQIEVDKRAREEKNKKPESL